MYQLLDHSNKATAKNATKGMSAPILILGSLELPFVETVAGVEDADVVEVEFEVDVDFVDGLTEDEGPDEDAVEDEVLAGGVLAGAVYVGRLLGDALDEAVTVVVKTSVTVMGGLDEGEELGAV